MVSMVRVLHVMYHACCRAVAQDGSTWYIFMDALVNQWVITHESDPAEMLGYSSDGPCELPPLCHWHLPASRPIIASLTRDDEASFSILCSLHK